jgi:hypothetical protein
MLPAEFNVAWQSMKSSSYGAAGFHTQRRVAEVVSLLFWQKAYENSVYLLI